MIYIHEISESLNNRVNFQKLYLELMATPIPVLGVEGIKGKIYVEVSTELSDELKLQLIAVINNHDGEDATAFSLHAIDAREEKIRELNQLAIFHPLLDNIAIVEYLTSIDNYINSYKRSGINTVLIGKIFADAQVKEPHYDFLNQVVNLEGNKTFEYFISKVM